MDQKQTSPDLSQAELPPAQEEQVLTNTPSRKRQLDSDDDAEPQTKRPRLTRQNLARLNKMGKKKNTDPSDDSDPISSKPPTNLKDLRERLAKSRQTASPPESVYKRYSRTVATAHNEATMVFEVGGKLLKEYNDDGYHREFNQAFSGYPKNVGFNNGLSTPQPDFVEGLEMEEFRPFPIGDHVSGAVLCKDDPRSVTLPHIAGEWKGRGKDMEEATLQSSYDGAALVYARNQALGRQGKADPPGHANITTFTTNGNQVNFYAHYATETEDGTLEYHQFPVKSTSLVNSHGEHKEGRRGLRNAQDYAREQSYALKDQLKEHHKQRSSGLHPIAKGVPTLPVPGTKPLHA